MTNLLDQTPTYITLEDFRDTATSQEVAALSDNDTKALIYQAQLAIDDYLKAVWYEPFVDWQDFLYPVNIDDVETIPNDISIATVYVAEYIYSKWLTQVADGIKAETTGDYKVEFFDISSKTNWYYIPEKAKIILDKYRLVFFWQVL